jgi:hypothetical protein
MDNQNVPIKDERQIQSEVSKFYVNNASSAVLAIDGLLGQNSDPMTILDEMGKLIGSVVADGDMSEVEGALIAQAKILQVIFAQMIRRTGNNNSMQNYKAYMDIGLRAQNQARKTLLALQSIKHPPQVTQIEQQNVAVNQQVNNGAIPFKKIKSKNELLEVKDGSMDTGTPFKAIKLNSPLETMEKSRG